MRVLVTGAAGFVGAHVLAELVARDYTTVAAHRGDPDVFRRLGILQARASSPEFVTCEITDPKNVEQLFAHYQPTHVLHAAAITPDPETETQDSYRVVETNELGTLAVLLAAARHNAQRVVFVSSSAVYAGSDSHTLLGENASLCEDCGLYGVTKLGAERLCQWATRTYKLDTRVVRLGPVYGPFERPTSSRRTMSAVHTAIHLAMAGFPLRCHTPHHTRDWIHGQDVAEAMIGLLTSPSLSHRLYNLSGEAVTMRRLLQAVAVAIPGTVIEWVTAPEEANIPGAAGSPTWRILDTRRLQADTGFSPRIAIEAGVRRDIASLSRHHIACSMSDE